MASTPMEHLPAGRRRETGGGLKRLVVLAIASLGLVLASAGSAQVKPTVVILILEKITGVYDTTGYEQPGHVEALLADKLSQMGFAVVDLQTVRRNVSAARARQLLQGDDAAAREVALQHEADYLLLGNALSKFAGAKLYGTQMRSIQANITVRLVRSGDGRVLGSGSAQIAKAHIDEVIGGIQALTEASDRILEQITPALQTALVQARTRSGSGELTVQISNLVSFRHLDFLMDYFQSRVPGVTDVQLKGYNGGLAVIGMTTELSANRIAETVVREKFKGFRLKPGHVSANRVELEAVLNK